LEKLSGFKSDFTLIETGQGVELKTDYWAMSKTPNFFFERYSDKARQTPGGPWQSIENGSDLFCYFYVKDLTFFRFETVPLVEALEEIIKTISPTDIMNKTYITQGYRVPRALLKDISEEFKLKVEIKK